MISFHDGLASNMLIHVVAVRSRFLEDLKQDERYMFLLFFSSLPMAIIIGATSRAIDCHGGRELFCFVLSAWFLVFAFTLVFLSGLHT